VVEFGLRTLLGEQLKVALARDACSSKVVLNDEDRHCGVLGNHHRPDHAGLGEDHVITFGADAKKTFNFENLDEQLIT
jgi:hypothetical protein